MILKEWKSNRLWYADMSYTKLGLSHIHRMVVIRLSDGSIVIHNPIDLSIKLQHELSKLGSIKSIICASPSYHQYLSDWWLSYPEALFYATPTLIQKRSDLNFDGALSNYAPLTWKNELLQTPLLGFDKPRKIIFCDPESRTLILSDHLLAVQESLPIGQKLLTWAHGINQDLKIPYSDKRHLSNMAALRASIQEVMTWPFDKLLSSNGLSIEQDAKKQFYQAFWWAF
ncbi:DUF4336 domain-containing protein [Vibrio algarum]|uniref:DUF4336 domain-containing protein n=1 Tax=Vibrio algarum TaxID=3020714 RepID=A0ABT4YVT2_9VIBR|nr:hypothetical protein [Vibrio sp. KJ40-1]MDB1125693.1 hypothetical protein [Vibrio sp. KJ40-1]